MKNKIVNFILLILFSSLTLTISAQRFPAPEFETGHEIPPTQITKVQPAILEYLDILVFLSTLSLITWVILKKRSRRMVFWISIFSLLYFGFYRKGCICPVGSVQNISLALFDPHYAIPITAILFFITPLAFTLFFGRTFCAGVCPLGAIQDLVALRPISLKSWIRSLLGLIPFIYLGLAILFAATGTDFIVCRYDPFVGFFRHNGSSLMFSIGGILLVTGVFIARPYCRFFCPYGVLLNLVSRFSRRHVSIANGKCINCRLCENACPFDAIDKPTGLEVKNDNRDLVKKLIIYGLITPVLVIVSGWTTAQYHQDFARVNFKVRLAEEMMNVTADPGAVTMPDEVTAFQSNETPVEQLYKETQLIIHKFRTGSWIVGGFIGLVFGLTLARLVIYRYREDYQTNKAECFSCARCMPFCPVK